MAPTHTIRELAARLRTSEVLDPGERDTLRSLLKDPTVPASVKDEACTLLMRAALPRNQQPSPKARSHPRLRAFSFSATRPPSPA